MTNSKTKSRLNFFIGLVAVMFIACLTAQTEGQENQDPAKKPIAPPTDPFSQTQTQQRNPRTQRPQQKPAATAPQQAGGRKEKVEIPAPEDLILDTSDGVRLKCTYLAPPKSKNAQAVPFILIHDWEGERNDLAQYALYLQNEGHAVIVPDLRGHGESLEITGRKEKIDLTRLRRGDVMSAMKDIERCKKFLVQRHNLGEVNVDMLSLVAVGKSAVLAVQWTLNDWVAFPPFSPKGIKQGQDVKALMLVSPEKKLMGIPLTNNLKHPLFGGANALPVLVIWSTSDEAARDSEGIFNNLEKARPDNSKIKDKAKRFAATTLFSVPIKKYKFTGAEMMSEQRVNNFWPYVTNLIFKNKVIDKADLFPWKTRELKEEEADE